MAFLWPRLQAIIFLFSILFNAQPMPLLQFCSLRFPLLKDKGYAFLLIAFLCILQMRKLKNHKIK